MILKKLIWSSDIREPVMLCLIFLLIEIMLILILKLKSTFTEWLKHCCPKLCTTLTNHILRWWNCGVMFLILEKGGSQFVRTLAESNESTKKTFYFNYDRKNDYNNNPYPPFYSISSYICLKIHNICHWKKNIHMANCISRPWESNKILIPMHRIYTIKNLYWRILDREN